MGSSHSYVTDPNAFATEVKENDDKSHWRSYDYVVVGGGAFRDGLHDRELLTMDLLKALLARCLHPVSQRIQTCRSS
jgi:hypothetical protein